MKDSELLEALKSEMLLTEARARGAKEAYELEAIGQARQTLHEEHKIKNGDRVIVHFTNGDLVYEFRQIAWGWSENEPVLMGRRILKSGKPSKNIYNETICGVSYLRNVKKQAPNASLSGLPRKDD